MSYKCQIVVDFKSNPTERKYRGRLESEIIEIGAVKLNDRLEEVDRFSCFVKPEYNNRIEPDVVSLTGIHDADVQEAVYLEEAISLLSKWVGNDKCRVLSWGDSALVQLEDECWTKGIEFPMNLTCWIDQRLEWQRIMHYPVRRRMSHAQAASICGIPYDRSKANRAEYAANVTAEILKQLKNRGYMESVVQVKSAAAAKVKHSAFSAVSWIGNKQLVMMPQRQPA